MLHATSLNLPTSRQVLPLPCNVCDKACETVGP